LNNFIKRHSLQESIQKDIYSGNSQAQIKICDFLKDYSPAFLSIEQPMISSIWGFAGTPDRVTSDGKYKYIVDIKTGVRTVAEEIQTALSAVEYSC
jgi:hypothetical protein